MMTDSTKPSLQAALDAGRWGGYQKFVVALTALAIIFDGFDNQILGFAIPDLISDWGGEKGDFSPVLAASLVGMIVGTLAGGLAGDRWGRRPALIACVLMFAIMTIASVAVDGAGMLAVFRFLAGLGLGGAMPNATALVADFTPERSRPFSVTATIVCVPLGGLLAGLLAAEILPVHGWRGLFLAGGILPLIVGMLLVFLLPETPRFLARRPARRDELRKVLGRIGLPLDSVDFSREEGSPPARTDDRPSGAGIATLFRAPLLRDTIALWTAFFACLLSVYMVFGWLPTLLAGEGRDLAQASQGLAAFNFGGIGGALVGALAIGRLGSLRVMGSLCMLGILAAGVLAFDTELTETFAGLVVFITILGISVNGTQTTLFALAAHVYPSHVRATGIGGALGIGRFGAVASSYLGAIAAAQGIGHYFLVIGVAMTVTLGALILVRNHIRP